jgi:hypothetical protein
VWIGIVAGILGLIWSFCFVDEEVFGCIQGFVSIVDGIFCLVWSFSFIEDLSFVVSNIGGCFMIVCVHFLCCSFCWHSLLPCLCWTPW